MLLCVHQLVSTCVCLLSAAEQVACSVFIRAFPLKAAGKEGDESDESTKKNPKQ